jgi:hypothetical protein
VSWLLGGLASVVFCLALFAELLIIVSLLLVCVSVGCLLADASDSLGMVGLPGPPRVLAQAENIIPLC